VTPVPLELPLNPAEAGELASLIFDQAERRPLTGELRNRLGARAAMLKLESITPYFGSLERDPVHPSAYYVAVDTKAGPALLLYLALATAPTSSIFHKPLLIGRMGRVNGAECVVNATPFGPADRGNIELFASRIDTAFLPRPLGSRAEVVVSGDAAGAFEAFRSVYRRTGKNLAAFAGGYHAGLWAAIRGGWRQGYAAVVDVRADSSSVDIAPHAACSRFAVDVSALEPFEPALKAAAQVHQQVRQARAGLKLSGAFEFEVGLPEASAADLEFCLDWLKTHGHAAQLVAPARTMGGLGADVEEAAAAARRQQATLSLRYRGEESSAIQQVAQATLGRVSIRVESAAEAAFVAENLLA
jgi:hypothetical protein